MAENRESPMGDWNAVKKWEAFVALIQAIWRTRKVPQQMTWIVLVILPKGNGDFHWIWLLEPFWKVLQNLMDARLEVIPLHDCLRGFTKG